MEEPNKVNKQLCKCDVCCDAGYLINKNTFLSIKQNLDNIIDNLDVDYKKNEQTLISLLYEIMTPSELITRNILINSQIVEKKCSNDIQQNILEQRKNRLKELKTLISNKRVSNNNLKELNKQIKININPNNEINNLINQNNINTNTSSSSEIFRNYKQIKIDFCRKNFDLLLIKTNSILNINDFLLKRESRSTIQAIFNVSNEGLVSQILDEKEEFFIKYFPFSFKEALLKNNFACVKINQFITSLIKFIMTISDKFKINLPHKLSMESVTNNKNNEKFNCYLETNYKWIRESQNLDNVLLSYYLINYDYNILLKFVFENEYNDNRKINGLFDFSLLVKDKNVYNENNKLIKEINIGMQNENEINGFLIV